MEGRWVLLVLKDKMTVMQVRPQYSIVYQFKPQVRVEEEYIRSEKDFVKFIKDVSTNWRDGEYFFRCTEGTFAYFTLNGRRVRLSKKSKQGKEYLCWQHFNEQPVANSIKVTKKTYSRAMNKRVNMKG